MRETYRKRLKQICFGWGLLVLSEEQFLPWCLQSEHTHTHIEEDGRI